MRVHNQRHLSIETKTRISSSCSCSSSSSTTTTTIIANESYRQQGQKQEQQQSLFFSKGRDYESIEKNKRLRIIAYAIESDFSEREEEEGTMEIKLNRVKEIIENVNVRNVLKRQVETSGAYGNISREQPPQKYANQSSRSTSSSPSRSTEGRMKKSRENDDYNATTTSNKTARTFRAGSSKIQNQRNFEASKYTSRETGETIRHTGILTKKKMEHFKQKNRKIGDAKNIKELLSFIESDVQDFSTVNCTTALHKIATTIRDQKSSDLSLNPTKRTINMNGPYQNEEEHDEIRELCEGMLDNPTFHKLLHRCIKMIPKTNDASNLTYVAQNYGTLSSREYANVLWSLAHLGVKTRLLPNELTTLVIHHYLQCAKENGFEKFLPQNVSNAIWAFAIVTSKVTDRLTMEDIDYEKSNITIKLSDFKDIEIDFASTYEDYGSLDDFSVELTDRFLTSIEQLTCSVMEDFAPQGISNSLWSFATCEYQLKPETEEAFKKGIAMNLGVPSIDANRNFLGAGNFKQMECSNIMWAVGQLKFNMGKDLASMFLQSARDNMRENPRGWSTQSISNILWAFVSTMNDPILGEVYKPPAGIFLVCEQILIQKFRTMVPQAIGNTLWCFSAFDYQPNEELLNRMSEKWDANLQDRTGIENCNVFWSYTKFSNFKPSQKFIDHICAEQMKSIICKEKWDCLGDKPFKLSKGGFEYELTVMSFMCVVFGLADFNIFPNDKGAYFRHVMSEMTAWLKLSYDPDQTNQNCTQPIVMMMRSFAVLKYLPDDDFVEAMYMRAKKEADKGQFTPQGISLMLWSFSSLGLKIPIDVIDAFSHALLRQMEETTNPQFISNSLWGLANMGMMHDKTVFESFKKKLNEISKEELESAYFDDNAHIKKTKYNYSGVHYCKTQLYSANFAYELLSPHGKLLNTELENACKKVWLKVTSECVSVSDFQRKVSSALTDMGVPHELEFLSEGGLFSLDIALKGRKVAIECDGPSHFAVNRPMVRIGGDYLREAILTKQGWKFVQIPWFEWSKVESNNERQRAYLANLLHEHLGLTELQLKSSLEEEKNLRDLGADVFMSELNDSTSDNDTNNNDEIQSNNKSESTSLSSSRTTFRPYGMDFEQTPPPPARASRITKSPSSTSSSTSSRVIKPVAQGMRRVSAKVPRSSSSSSSKVLSPSNLSDAESKRLSEKLLGPSRKVSVKRVKRIVSASSETNNSNKSDDDKNNDDDQDNNE